MWSGRYYKVNTMKSALLKHSLLVCVLWLLTCCTGAASEDYRRTMWVSTTGEDSPQCIHDTPASDPVPRPHHLNESCGSLNYALTHIGNDTLIVMGCGIHVLEPVDNLLDGTPLMNVTTIVVMSGCEADPSVIQCTDGAKLAFYNVENVHIENIAFQDCGRQLQHSDSVSDSSTLHFQNCEIVKLFSLLIKIRGPYGRGISFTRYNTSITQGDVLICNVAIVHYGFHGSGIHFEFLTGSTRDASLAKEKIQLRNLTIYIEENGNQSNCALTFTGINITVMGDGDGGEITLFNVTIYSHLDRTSSGSGISIALLDTVCHYNILLEDVEVLEDCRNLHNSSNRTVSGTTIDEQFCSNTTKDALNTITHTSIKIELRGNSSRNHIQIGPVGVWVVSRSKERVAPGSTLSIEVTDQSEGNVVLLQDIYLKGSNSSNACRRGLQVYVTRWAKRNAILVTDILLKFHRALCGAGGYFEFSGHATGNLVEIKHAYFRDNHAFWGGSIAIVCTGFATHNTFNVHNIVISNSFAVLGGGVLVNLQDSSSKNTIQLAQGDLFSNTACRGGGMLLQIKDASKANVVVIRDINIMFNKLLPSEKHDMMGGGVHVEFSTVSVTFQTNNIVTFTKDNFAFNTAGPGVGGGISVLYKHSHYQDDSGDRLTVENAKLYNNMAASGSACAFQSLPTHEKKLFRGVRMTNCMAGFSILYRMNIKQQADEQSFNESLYIVHINSSSYESMAVRNQEISQGFNPSFQVKTNTNLIFAKSVEITVSYTLSIQCAASSQGIYALGSEIVLQANTLAHLALCVATHGGAIALHGESYIRVGKNATLQLIANYAFQRGGAIYVSSAPGVVPVSNCFLQYDQEWEESSSAFVYEANTAVVAGLSLYMSDARNCHSQTTRKNISTNLTPFSGWISFSVFDIRNFNFSFIYLANKSETWADIQWEIMSGISHVDNAWPTSVPDMNRNMTKHMHYFIPGKQKRLTYTHAYDEFGNIITPVFAVLINKIEHSLPMELSSFSKYTADFRVILHGIPQQHGMAKHSFPSNTSNISAVVRPPQLVLQSVDNTDLLLVMNIELQCCPPGYILQYGSGDKGTCHCGVLIVIGIADCNESHPEVIGAVLERDYWAGYLHSNDQHSCDGQKFFTGPCPPGYCQTHLITLPENNSQQMLQEVMCNGCNRKGILCGDCLEGNSIAVNFNGIRPVCVSCEDGLSKVGILVWILSEWVPMLAFMFVLILFNIDLVSGRFNSFLLFAQLLAFSTIRGDAELGPVHNAFVRIYRFLYGMWNLDFFGVLLPPYCLTPHTHLTLLQTILLHYSIGLFPLTVAITLIVLERSAEKWICCHRVDQCLRRMRRWKAKYSDGMSYDRALPAFVILGFTRFLVSSTYILVNQTITGEDEERKVVVWWQGSVLYGSIQHIAYFIPAIAILLVFVLLPSFVLLTLPIGPQLFGRLLIAVPPLRKLQRMQTFCSNVYTDRWVYHFVNVLQGCYKERFRSFSSLYLFHRIAYLFVAVFIPRAEDVLRIQIFLVVALLLLITALQPYNSRKLNALDAAVLGNMALILILSLHITDPNTPIGTRQFFASIQMILIYLPLLYPGILLGRKVYLKCKQLRCCQKQEEQSEDNAEPLLEAPAERLGNLVLITELRAGVPTSEDDGTVTETETETDIAS